MEENKMKKFAVLMCMMMMLFSVSLTVSAKDSPDVDRSYNDDDEDVEVTTTPAAPVQIQTNVSPKTGESDTVLFYVGTAAVLFAAGSVVVRMKAKEA